jgi:hypothetical protein
MCSSAYTRAQMSKYKLNSQIVNSNLKYDRDLHLGPITHLDEGIFRPSEQDLSRDRQAHWQQGTSSQNPQF